MINQNKLIQIMYYIEWYNDFINADEKINSGSNSFQMTARKYLA